MKTVFLLACLLLGVAMARHTKKHRARDIGSDIVSAISGDGGSGGDWPNPGSLGGFGVPSGLLPGSGQNGSSDGSEGAPTPGAGGSAA